MSDLRDFTGKNRRFTGTDAETISSGTTAERVDGTGKLRFNSTTNLMEYYTGTEWKSIDAPPIITGFTVAGGSDVTSAIIDNSTGGNVTIEIKGSLFDTTGATVTFVGTGETLSTTTTTRNNSSLLTVTIPYASFDSGNEPYTIKVANGSGLSAELTGAISADQPVTFTNAADTNYDILNSLRSSGTIAAGDLCGATDADSDTITYSVSAGALPSGCTLNTSTAAITWSSVSAVSSDTISTFTISAATTDLTVTRQFTITVKAPVTTSYTSTGAFTFSVPSGVTAVDVLMVAGGGGGGAQCGAGGGAGGLIYRPGFPVTPGGSVPGSVATGGNPSINQSGTYPSGQYASNGADTTFGSLTAKGGGRGGYWTSGYGQGSPGGSGGGSNNQSPGSRTTSTQPSQPGDSGTYGFGNPGGSGPAAHFGGGGGGAGAAGQDAGSNGGDGGNGRAYSTSGSSVTYAGGGGGGSHEPAPRALPPGGSGGGGFGITACANSGRAQDGTDNRGGGGGGAGCPGGSYSQGGGGGTGIVIVSY